MARSAFFETYRGVEGGECEGLGGGLALELGEGFGGDSGGLFVFALVPLLHQDLFEVLFVGFGGVFADGSDHGAGFVEFDFVDGFEGVGGRFGEIERGGLEGVEEQAGSFGVETAVRDPLRY